MGKERERAKLSKGRERESMINSVIEIDSAAFRSLQGPSNTPSEFAVCQNESNASTFSSAATYQMWCSQTRRLALGR